MSSAVALTRDSGEMLTMISTGGLDGSAVVESGDEGACNEVCVSGCGGLHPDATANNSTVKQSEIRRTPTQS